MKISFVIPAYNDEKTIQEVVVSTHNIAKKVSSGYEILVTDDGSRDDTAKVLRDIAKTVRSLRVYTHPQNQGYGATIKELYYMARFKWLFSLPGDGQIDPSEIATLMAQRNDADIIIGYRKRRNDPKSRLRQSKLYNGLLRTLFHLRLHDINSVRLMRTSIFKEVAVRTDSAFVDAEIVIAALKKGYKVIEVPIRHKRREGSVGGGGNWRTILPVIKDMMVYFFQTKYTKVFYERTLSGS